METTDLNYADVLQMEIFSAFFRLCTFHVNHN